MLKLVGAILILAACAFAGFYYANRLSKRMVELSELQTALIYLESEINHGATPLPEAFKMVSKQISGKTGDLFSKMYNTLRSNTGITAGSAWNLVVQDWYPATSLNFTDKEILLQLSPGLGAAPLQEQIKRIQMIIQRLLRAEAQAIEQWKKYGKIYSYGGVLSGLVIALVAW